MRPPVVDPLELATRRQLYAQVQSAPGSYLRELQRATGLAMGALEHHLDTLVRAGLVTSLHDGHKRYFPSEMDAGDKRVLAFLRQELPRRILAMLMARGACGRAELARTLDCAPSTLAYHLGHLVDDALLANDAGTGYNIVDPARVFRLLVAHRSSFVDRWLDGFVAGVDALRP